MDELEMKIQQLKQDVAKWKNRAVEAADRACMECEALHQDCEKCRMQKIKEEAGKC